MKHEYPMHRKKKSKLLKMNRKDAQFLKSLEHQVLLEDTGFMVQGLKRI
jgi:hypothetical protein